jgi:hypothetical protein
MLRAEADSSQAQPALAVAVVELPAQRVPVPQVAPHLQAEQAEPVALPMRDRAALVALVHQVLQLMARRGHQMPRVAAVGAAAMAQTLALARTAVAPAACQAVVPVVAAMAPEPVMVARAATPRFASPIRRYRLLPPSLLH